MDHLASVLIGKKQIFNFLLFSKNPKKEIKSPNSTEESSVKNNNKNEQNSQINEKKENLNLFLNENQKKLIEPHKIIIREYELTNEFTN